MVALKAKIKMEKESIELLELALSCKLISLEQEKQALIQILEQSKKDPKISIATFLVQQKILDKDKIEFLFAVKKHLSTLMLDKKFGKLGVANEFVRQEKIDKALAIQVKIFKQAKKSVKIGDILENNNDISKANKTAILLTQDRIRDEFLIDALNTIANSEIDRLAINKRFGAIAVKKQLITTEQLNQALKFQKKEAREQGSKRYLGEILKQLFDLTDEQIMAILKIQKKLEAKRMNLQKKVLAFNVEKESIKMLDQFLELNVSDDKLSANLLLKQGDRPKINVEDVIKWLASEGIRYGLCEKKEIACFFEKSGPGKKIKIARGLAPTMAKKEQIKFAFENDPDVAEDEVLATVVPFAPGTPGKDVFGHAVNIEQDTFAILKSGEGVVRRDNEFIAVVDGRPQVYKNRTIFVVPAKKGIKVKQIEGDITKETENDYVDCDLTVSGNISTGATIVCHSLMVKGDILGNVSAAKDIEVDGNIGESTDSQNAKASIQVATQGKLLVNGKVICAKIVTDKGLIAPQADVINSRVFSSGDVMVNNIRSSKALPTVVRISKKNSLALQKLAKEIKLEKIERDALTHKSERDALTKKLMEQIRIQNGYLEKQSVLSYLVRLMDQPGVKNIETLGKTIESDWNENKNGLEKDRKIIIAKNTKAYAFMGKLLVKLKTVEQKDLERYIKALHDSVTGIYRAAVKVTDRINKEFEAKVKQIDAYIEKHKKKIEKKEQKISQLMSQKDYYKVKSAKLNIADELLVKVKNEVGQHTIIKGETAQLMIDKSVYGVFIKERNATSDKDAKMVVDGYFG